MKLCDDHRLRHESRSPRPMLRPLHALVAPGKLGGATPIRDRINIPHNCPTCEDAEWLIDAGETPDRTASSTRLGRSKLSNLRTHLRRHGRPDLADRLDRERDYA